MNALVATGIWMANVVVAFLVIRPALGSRWRPARKVRVHIHIDSHGDYPTLEAQIATAKKAGLL